MSEIYQFHQLVTLVRGMRKPVEMSDDSLIALDDEITALVEEMKGELNKLTQELYDSKYLAAQRLKSLNAWKAKAKQWRESGNAYFEAYKEASTDRFELGTKWALAEALAAERLKMLRELLAVAKYYKPVSLEYPPSPDEDEETWAIGELYSRVEKELDDE